MNVDQKDFDVKFKDLDENSFLKLITPLRLTAVSNGAWTAENLWLRSRVEDNEGTTVSQSFGKFFNLGQGPLGLQVTVQDILEAIEKRDAYATLKLDGSALIRSVFNRDVIIRTRGSFGYEHQDNAWEVDQIFREKYPKLFDPTWGLGASLIFEWTTPNNTIVIKYPEPEITLVGGVYHDDMTYMRLAVLSMLAESIGCPVVPHFKLDAEGWTKLIAEMATNKYDEGYVIRIHKQQTLVKVKCDSYLAKHRLKSNMSTENLIDLWLNLGMPTFKEFVAYFEREYDEEIAMWALPVISTLMDGVKEVQRITSHIGDKVQAAQESQMTRKDFALSMQAQYGHTKKFSLAMSLWQGRNDNRELIKGLLLQNTKQMELGMFKGTSTDDLEDQ